MFPRRSVGTIKILVGPIKTKLFSMDGAFAGKVQAGDDIGANHIHARPSCFSCIKASSLSALHSDAICSRSA